MSAPMVQAQGLEFGYGPGSLVLKGVALEVPRGSCLCLMGANGCGKSTLIDCVLGHNAPSAGTVRVAGHDPSRLGPRALAHLVSYVPQVHERTFPYEVRHVVLMGRTAHSRGLAVPDADDEARAQQALAACGIAHLAERPCTELSGGEMQMVLLARALAQDAPLVVMDEPTAHLDFRNELLFLETVERLVGTSGVTVLMATHAPNQAFHLVDAGINAQVALMAGGVVADVGQPADVLTPEALAAVFGVRAEVWRRPSGQDALALGSAGERSEGWRDASQLRQVVPRATLGALCEGGVS